MGPSQADILNELQMADLGTARREHVSTMDDPKKISRVRMEELEAQRASNIRGTASQREAAQKQSALDSWKNLSKIVDDTGGLERLANIMQGQSHRSGLNAAIAGYGGQNYDRPKSSKGSKSAVTAAVTAAIPQALRNVQTKPSSLPPRSDTSSPPLQSVTSESFIGRYPVHPAYTPRAGGADVTRGRGRAIRGPHDPPVAKKQNQRTSSGGSTGSSRLDPALEPRTGVAGISRRNISSIRNQGTRHIAPRQPRPNPNLPTIGSPADFLAQLQAIGAKLAPVQVAPPKTSEEKETTNTPKAAQEVSQLIQKYTDKVSRIASAPFLDAKPQSVPAEAESTKTPTAGSLPVVNLPLVKEPAIAHEEPSKVPRGVVSFRIPQVVENSSQPKVRVATKSLLDESPDNSPTKAGDPAPPFETEGLVIRASTPTKAQAAQLSDSKAADVKLGLLVDFYKHNQEVTQASPMTPSTLADISGLDFMNEPEPEPEPEFEHGSHLEPPELSTSSQDPESSGSVAHEMTDEERITKFAQAAKELLETPNTILHIPKEVLNFLRQSAEVANMRMKEPGVSDSKADSSNNPIKVDSTTVDPSKEKEFSPITSTQKPISDILHAKEMSTSVVIGGVQEKTDTRSLGSATMDESSFELSDFDSPTQTPAKASPSVFTKPRLYTPERFGTSNSFRDYRDREPTPSTGDSRKEKFFDAQQEVNSSPKKKADSATANDDSKLIGKVLETFQFSDSSAPASQKHSRNTSEDCKIPDAKKLKPETTPARVVVPKTNPRSPAQLHTSRWAMSNPDPDTFIPKIPEPPTVPFDRLENDWTEIEMAEEEDKKHRAGSINIKAVPPKPNSLSESIYARDWNLHHQLGEAKVIGPAPYSDDKRFCRVVEAAVNARPGSVSSHKSFRSRVLSSSEKDIPNANPTIPANTSSQSTSPIIKGSIQPTHKGVRTIGPPPYNPALKNVLKVKPSTQGASQSVPAASTAPKGVRVIGPSGSFNPGFKPTGIPTPNTPYSLIEKNPKKTKVINPLSSAKLGTGNERSVTGGPKKNMSTENDPFMDLGCD